MSIFYYITVNTVGVSYNKVRYIKLQHQLQIYKNRKKSRLSNDQLVGGSNPALSQSVKLSDKTLEAKLLLLGLIDSSQSLV